MNLKLQTLADQATDDILGMPVLDPERFAQLILKECIHIARLGLSPAVAEVIQEHFGVDHE